MSFDSGAEGSTPPYEALGDVPPSIAKVLGAWVSFSDLAEYQLEGLEDLEELLGKRLNSAIVSAMAIAEGFNSLSLRAMVRHGTSALMILFFLYGTLHPNFANAAEGDSSRGASPQSTIPPGGPTVCEDLPRFNTFLPLAEASTTSEADPSPEGINLSPYEFFYGGTWQNPIPPITLVENLSFGEEVVYAIPNDDGTITVGIRRSSGGRTTIRFILKDLTTGVETSLTDPFKVIPIDSAGYLGFDSGPNGVEIIYYNAKYSLTAINLKDRDQKTVGYPWGGPLPYPPSVVTTENRTSAGVNETNILIAVDKDCQVHAAQLTSDGLQVVEVTGPDEPFNPIIMRASKTADGYLVRSIERSQEGSYYLSTAPLTIDPDTLSVGIGPNVTRVRIPNVPWILTNEDLQNNYLLAPLGDSGYVLIAGSSDRNNKYLQDISLVNTATGEIIKINNDVSTGGFGAVRAQAVQVAEVTHSNNTQGGRSFLIFFSAGHSPKTNLDPQNSRGKNDSDDSEPRQILNTMLVDIPKQGDPNIYNASILFVLPGEHFIGPKSPVLLLGELPNGGFLFLHPHTGKTFIVYPKKTTYLPNVSVRASKDVKAGDSNGGKARGSKRFNYDQGPSMGKAFKPGQVPSQNPLRR